MKKYRSMFNKAVAGIALTAGLTACNFKYSDGDRVGVVTKISNKGFVCKTWEGELAMDGFVRRTNSEGSSSASNVFEFSITDQAIVEKVKAAQESGERVKLHYNQILLRTPCTSDTQYRITDVSSVAQKTVKTPQPQ